MAKGRNVAGERLKARLSEIEKDQGWLAGELGVSQSAISQIITGKSQRSRLLPEIASKIDVNLEWLLGHTNEKLGAPGGSTASTGEVEIVGIDLRYGLGGTFLEEHVEETRMKFPLAWIRQFTDAPPDMLRWTAGVGNSMEPTIGDGEPVLIDLRHTNSRMADLIWVFAWGEVGMMKRLRPLPDGSVEILSDNPVVPAARAGDGEIHIIGRVCGVMKRL